MLYIANMVLNNNRKNLNEFQQPTFRVGVLPILGFGTGVHWGPCYLMFFSIQLLAMPCPTKTFNRECYSNFL